MKRVSFLAYGVIHYVLFLVIYLYFAAFLANVGVPYTVDSMVDGCGRLLTESAGAAVMVNLFFVFVFAVQHSVMARPGFKKAWTMIVPKPIERSTYVFLSNVVMVILIWQWQPIEAVVWDVQQPILRGLLWTLFVVGVLLVPFVTFLLDHFDLFGLRQVWFYFQEKEYVAKPFATPLFYKYVRHPLYIGWAMVLWMTPTMSLGHLLLAASLTVYMLVAVVREEHDLVAYFGDQYREYRRQVPMFIPGLGGRKKDR